MVRFANPRDRHPYHMHDMIRAQPEYVAETLALLKAADVETFLEEPDYLVVTGCGTSFHAAMYGARVLQMAWGKRAVVHAVHAFDLRHGGLPDGAEAVLAISHSGSTATTNKAVKLARRGHLRTLALCGMPGSPLEDVAEATLVIGTTHDRSWANTMSYTTQLTALAYLARNAGDGLHGVGPGSLSGIPRLLRTPLRLEASLRRLARRIAREDRVTFLGTGLDAITALEGALKIRETCGMTASGYQLEQFLHGPFLSLDRRESVVALLSKEDCSRGKDILRALAGTGARVTTIGDDAHADLRMPRIPPVLRPIASVIPLQLLAYHAALARGTNPDVMRADIPRYNRALEPLFS